MQVSFWAIRFFQTTNNFIYFSHGFFLPFSSWNVFHFILQCYCFIWFCSVAFCFVSYCSVLFGLGKNLKHHLHVLIEFRRPLNILDLCFSFFWRYTGWDIVSSKWKRYFSKWFEFIVFFFICIKSILWLLVTHLRKNNFLFYFELNHAECRQIYSIYFRSLSVLSFNYLHTILTFTQTRRKRFNFLKAKHVKWEENDSQNPMW